MAQLLRVVFIGEHGLDTVIAELQRGGYAPEIGLAGNPEQLREALSAKPDVAISDFFSNGFSALEALRLIQECNVDLPLIVVSGEISDADVLTVLKAGAADHMTRHNLMRLNAAVEREIRSVKMRRDRIRLEEQFRHAQKLEAVGRLAGGVAHDFNNLLTVIAGYTELLLASRDLQGSHRMAVEEIRRSAGSGGELTHQLLAFSRRQPMETQAIRINDLVLHMEKMLRRLIGEDIELVTIASASNDSVLADPGRLEQVIMNLVVNARDAMPDGGKLTIETGTRDISDTFTATRLGISPGTYATIAIADTGAGMDEETMSHLFEPFFTTKRPGRGTGLGLATAYGIIRQSGGAIGIDSKPGHGTIARIYLPASQQKAPDASNETSALIPLNGGETILVVEDESRVRKLILDILTGRGYRVLEATRGEEALRLCSQNGQSIDLAVVDVVMPEMSGLDLVRQMSRLCPSMRVLYISGYTDEALIHHGIPESGVAFLPKPFVPDQLARKVREVLEGRSGTASG